MDRFETAERRRKLRQRAVEFLGNQCTICKYDGCLEAMDFHHRSDGERLRDQLEDDFVESH
jgi:hypothetical protein